MSNKKVSIIDMHSHFYPRWYIDRLRSRTALPRVTEDADGEKFVIFAEEELDEDLDRLVLFLEEEEEEEERLDAARVFLHLKLRSRE